MASVVRRAAAVAAAILATTTTTTTTTFFFPPFASGLASPPSSPSSPYDVLRTSNVIDPRTNERTSPLDDSDGTTGRGKNNNKSLVVLLPQLGEFDSSEFCEHLVAVEKSLDDANIDMTVIGIGEVNAAKKFCDFTGLSIDVLKVDPDGTIHDSLDLHDGPGLSFPDFVSDDALTLLLKTLPGGPPKDSSSVRLVANAWLNYLAMCAGIGAPGTLKEILRGYFGDASAPERLNPDEIVKAGFVEIGPGVGPVKIGPFRYSNWWADERGYQRPVELATVRLKNMVEILSNWDEYVTNPLTISKRGATYLFDNKAGTTLYEYRHPGVLTYSETMSRPLTFLAPYLGENVARNPLGLPDADAGGKDTKGKFGRGPLKPAGKAMGLFRPIFAFETELQAKLTGVDESDMIAAREKIETTISNNRVTVFTYGWSPFSSETVKLLECNGCDDYARVQIGQEWFLLGREGSALRSALLERTGQSSLPSVFVEGTHVGGLFTGPPPPLGAGTSAEEKGGGGGGGGGGLAALQESGKLEGMLRPPETTTTAAERGGKFRNFSGLP